MDPVTTGAIISAGANLIGGMAGNASARSLSREQMRWEERMSNTAVARRVRDLRNAGLNPALAYGADASTPSAGIAELPNANLGEAVSSAVLMRQQLRLIRAQANKAEQEGAHESMYNSEEYQNAFLANLQANTAKSLSEGAAARALLPARVTEGRVGELRGRLLGGLEDLWNRGANSAERFRRGFDRFNITPFFQR